MLLVSDPIILLAPVRGAKKPEWLDYYHYLQKCIDIVDSGLHDITLSEICLDALYDSDRYPTHIQELQDWLNEAGIADINGEKAEFDAKTLFSLLTFLTKQKNLEKHLEVEYHYDKVDSENSILIEGQNLILLLQTEIKIRPTKILSRLTNQVSLMKAFHLTAGIIVYALSYLKDPKFSLESLAILTVNDSSEDMFEWIEVDAVINEKNDTARQLTLNAFISPKQLLEMGEDKDIVLQLWPNIESMFQRLCITLKGTINRCLLSHSLISQLQRNKGDTFFILEKLRKLIVSATNSEAPFSDERINHRLYNQDLDGEWEPRRFWITKDGYRIHYWWNKDREYFVFSKIISDHDDYSIELNTQEKQRLLQKLS